MSKKLGGSKMFRFNLPRRGSGLQSFLTPRALAFFYMDDGAVKWLGHSNAMRICTESLSEKGMFLLSEKK